MVDRRPLYVMKAAPLQPATCRQVDLSQPDRVVVGLHFHRIGPTVAIARRPRCSGEVRVGCD